MGKGVVKLGDGNWAVKDGNLLAVKETNRRFKNTEFIVERGTRATYVGRDGLIKESDLQNTNLVLNGNYEELGSEILTQPVDLTSNFVNNAGGLIVDTDTFTTGGGALDGIVSNVILTEGKTYKLIISGNTTSSGFTIGNTQGSGGQYGTGFGTHYFTATSTNPISATKIWIRQETAGTTNITSFSIKQVDPNDRWSLGTNVSISDGKLNWANSPNNNGGTQSSSLTQGKTYKVTFTVSDYSSGSVRIRFPFVGIRRTANGTYTQVGVADQSTSDIFIQGEESGGNTATLSVDNIVIQEIKTATPRIDFTNNTDGHLLLEPARTNLIEYSEDFSSYSPILGIITESGQIDPNGNNTAYKLTNFASSSSRFDYNTTTTAVNGSTYTYSAFYKGSGTIRINCSTSTGVGGAGEKDIVLTNEWTRHSISFTASNPTGAVKTHTAITRTPNNDAVVYLAFTQIEEGAYPTSYIPTYGATATRSADVCKNSGTVADFNSTEGVLFADIAALNSTTENQISICLSNSGGTDRLLLYFGSPSSAIQAQFRKNSSTYVAINTGVVKTNQNKVAMSWKSGKNVLFANGVKATAYGTGSETTATTFDEGDITSLQFSPGKNFTSNYFFGKTKQLEVYKTGFSDDQLIRLTGTLGTHFFESYTSMAGALTYTIQ